MDYFPLSLAVGYAFCNRTVEQRNLTYNLLESRPTLIVSPRRYGKTSLALHTLKQSKLIYMHFDFFSAINEQDIQNIILKGAGQLIGQIEKIPQKMLTLATEFFSGLSIKFSLDSLGLSVEFNTKPMDTASTILNILERIEKLSKKYNKKLVLFFDEFQRIYQIAESHPIESVIRQVAQLTKTMSFIFSGSNRHLLYQIFNDRSRPFYKLCDRISLERISSSDYEKFLQVAAKENWHKLLDNRVINKILDCTEKHPYYVNLLCSRLWKMSDINTDNVEQTWSTYIKEERANVGIELDLLSANQRKLLIALARYEGTRAPRGMEFQQITGMAGATVTQALRFLEKMDYIYQDSHRFYRVLDPMIKAVLTFY